ncbi:hypothetical protein [Alkalihalobacillus sp. R86527]|uniref:hypothetical protein n=1 Tax=Alkalihalobacillus sp. R86527 TaxID=3093863 RepID=UPI00366F776F
MIDKNNEEKILEELKSINQKLTKLEEGTEERSTSSIGDMIQSLLIGLLIGGVIAIGFGLVQVVSSWIL